MSWDASLSLASGRYTLRDWNYTHNTNRMIGEALRWIEGQSPPETDHPVMGPLIGPAWWRRLDGTSGADGAAYLDKIVTALEARPTVYRAMNPENGWGDYDGLLEVLRGMRDAVPPEPTVWWASG